MLPAIDGPPFASPDKELRPRRSLQGVSHNATVLSSTVSAAAQRRQACQRVSLARMEGPTPGIPPRAVRCSTAADVIPILGAMRSPLQNASAPCSNLCHPLCIRLQSCDVTDPGKECSALPPPKSLFCLTQDFRGREPSTEPLLRHNDLLPGAGRESSTASAAMSRRDQMCRGAFLGTYHKQAMNRMTPIISFCHINSTRAVCLRALELDLGTCHANSAMQGAYAQIWIHTISSMNMPASLPDDKLLPRFCVGIYSQA